jgi:hypothetical protein
MRVATCLALVYGLFACSSPPESPREPEPPPVANVLEARRVAWDPAERQQALGAGRAALLRHQCNRCHVIDDIEASSRPTHCVSCHVFLDGLTPSDHAYQTIASRYGEPVLQRYQRNIVHFVAVPDLTLVARRLRPEWIASFIRDPHDLRPMMEETMVRTEVSEEDALAIARYFAAVAQVAPPRTGDVPELGPRPTAAHIREGQTLFSQRGCNLCHTVGNLRLGKTEQEIAAVGLGARLAPNLRFARERMDRDVLVAWIRDPHAFLPTTPMPNLAITGADAARLADFILFVDPRLEPAVAPDMRLPPAVNREVSFEEVKERVLGRVCVHCHMNDHERDPGPGNEGGFGWPGEDLSMRTYEMLVSGARLDDHDEQGAHAPMDGGSDTHTSVLTAEDGGIPVILASMLRRREEAQRDLVRAFHDHAVPTRTNEEPGMPMGLPPMDDEAFGILRAWIEQGCVGPRGVSGMPGIDDGYLVPDGPIAVNRGCEVRAPAVTRPAWSTQPPPAFERPRDAGTAPH